MRGATLLATLYIFFHLVFLLTHLMRGATEYETGDGDTENVSTHAGATAYISRGI